MAASPPQIWGLTDWRALSRGGFAIVWVARQESLNRLVAVKVDRRTLDSDAEQRRFLREAGAVGRMSGHPGIVTVHDAGILGDNRPYLVMKLCEGGSLTKWVKADQRPSVEHVQEVGVLIADALAATHARGVLHRDVKPANILMDSYGHAGLADFGLAALSDPGLETESFEAITPAYAPPEVLNRKPPTEAGDVYSLGATLYALLAGHPPRWPDDGMPTVSGMLSRLDDPIERIPGVDSGLMDVLLRAMATHPADRLTAAQLRDQLSELNLRPPPPEARRAAAPAIAAGADSDHKEPTTDPWPTKSGQRSLRPRNGVLVAAVVILASAVTIGLVSLLPVGGRPVAGSTPSGTRPISPTGAGTGSAAVPPSAASTIVTPPPTTQLPASYTDCSDKLGPETFCTPEPECWGAVRSYADAPMRADPVDCFKTHIYQTFAAGMLTVVPRTQSSLEKLPQVKRVCNENVVNKMLGERDRRSDWEVYALPPQTEDEMFYRCIFGRGLREAPLTLHPLR